MKFKICTALAVLTAVTLVACSDSNEPPELPALDTSAIEANNRAVGLMGQFEYAQAQLAFAELATKWPDWHDIGVNLAIATLNRQQAGDEQTALELVNGVLEADPDHLRAHFVAGLLKLYLGKPAEALVHFEFVAGEDADDAYAAYYAAQCRAQQGDHAGALTWYQRAMEQDPYLRSAYYGAFQSMQRLGRAQEASALAEDYQRLEKNPRSYLAEFKYTRMGTKAEAMAIDLAAEEHIPQPQGPLFEEPVILPPGRNFSRLGDGVTPGTQLSLTTADMQGDGLHDLFLTGADSILVLLGQADGKFQPGDDHVLAAVPGVNAMLWGDYDNDGLLDVYLCRSGENQLWRQIAWDDWENVTSSASASGGSFNTVDGAFFDADHDGDLDLFLVNEDGPNELLNNNLDGSFRPLAADYGLAGEPGAGSMMVLPADLDNDRDVDLLVLNANAPHDVFLNDRLWSYRPAEGFGAFSARPAQAVLAADIDANGQIELYTATPEGELLRWQASAQDEMEADLLAVPAVLEGAAWSHLAAHDVDGDGVPDLIASSPRGWVVLKTGPDALEVLHESLAPVDSPMLASLPFIGDSLAGPAMVTFSGSMESLALWPPGPGRHPFVTISLSGREDNAHSMRSNASGIGADVAVRSGSAWSRMQNYRSTSAPGQSLQPLAIGLGGARRADFIAIDWSDGVFQSEVSVETGSLREIAETQRQLSSCPVLFAWNGEEYAFVSDFLGVGGMGYAIGPGQYTTPRPWENYLLPDGLLKAKRNRYQLKISEPMEENAYIDSVRLAVYDLPPGWQMVMDDRMGISAPEPTGEPRFFQRELSPIGAVNDRGENVLDRILHSDGAAAPVGELDSRFIGRLSGEHILILDFPEPLGNGSGAPMLLIDGWVEYPYSQTNFAAWQAGASYDAPTLEVLVDGQWKTLASQFGYPAGMPRRMSLPISGLPAGATQLRLRTNMQIYWDRIAIAFAEDPPGQRLEKLPAATARLAKTGFARRNTYDQFRPDYDYGQLSPFWDTRYMSGYYTRLGNIEELVSKSDDAVAIIGPGEEIHIEFDRAPLPPDGWKRHFVLETTGWAKDMDLFTRDGETVGPLPSTGKPEAARDQLHARYNTRYQAGY